MNGFELFNEVMILTIGYLTMTLVGFMRSPLESEDCGLCIIWVIRIHIGLNIIYILYGFVKKILLYCKRYMLRRSAKRMIEQRKENVKKMDQRLAQQLSVVEELS